MPKITVNGFELYFEDAGSGVPVVYIHGGFASLDTILLDLAPFAWTWEKDLADEFHFITYDRRGCYRSSCPEEGYELINQAHDLESLLEHLHITSIHVIGSSAGGPIAITFAATQLNRVRSLVLVGTGLNLFPRGEPVSDLIRQQILLLHRDGAEVAFDQRPAGVEVSFKVLWEQEEMAERGTLQEYSNQQRVLAQEAAKLPKGQRIRHYIAELRNMKAYMDTDVSVYARQLAVPTLVLHGSNDREVPPAWAEQMARIIPTAQFQVMQGASHSLMIRNPEARRTVKEWIRRVEEITE